MAQRSKQERKDLMARAGMAGSSSRSGPDDPRHRRGAQVEMDVGQRFDPDDFEVDSEQRVKVKKSAVGAQAVCLETGTHSISVAHTWYTIGLIAPATSVGTFITVNTAGDHITLQGGHVYMVSAYVHFTNSRTASGQAGYIYIRSIAGEGYGWNFVRIAPASDEHGGTRDPGSSLYLSAVVDVSARGSLDIDIQVRANHAEVDVRSGGWITVQRIG